MKHVFQKVVKLPITSVIIFSGLLLMVISSCQKETRQTATEELQSVVKPPKLAKDFTQVNLVGNNDEYAPAFIDPNLINGWGIAFSSGGTAWVSAEGTGKSVVYNREGVAQGISPVAIP